MERRVLLAVTLSFLVLVLYQRWIGPPPPVETVFDTPAGGVASVQGDSDASAGRLAAVGVPGSVPPAAVASDARSGGAAASGAPEIVPVTTDDRPRTIVVESDFVLAEFDNRGAELVSWKLKQYADENGDPVELALPAVAAGRRRPFSLSVPGDPDLTARLDSALFRPSVDYLRLTNDPAALTFEYEDSSACGPGRRFAFSHRQTGPTWWSSGRR